MPTPTCPCCCAELPQSPSRFYDCPDCGARLSDGCTPRQGLAEVSGAWDPSGSFEGARYFDFIVEGREGRYRRHGWYNPETRGIVQVG